MTLRTTTHRTTTHRTTTLRTTTSDDLTDALDRLATAAEQAPENPRTRAVLAVVVQRLEDAAGAWLGDADGEPLVVLQRRFGRAHARLVADGRAALDADLLHGLARALRPEAADDPRPSARPVPTAVLAGC